MQHIKTILLTINTIPTWEGGKSHLQECPPKEGCPQRELHPQSPGPRNHWQNPVCADVRFSLGGGFEAFFRSFMEPETPQKIKMNGAGASLLPTFREHLL